MTIPPVDWRELDRERAAAGGLVPTAVALVPGGAVADLISREIANGTYVRPGLESRPAPGAPAVCTPIPRFAGAEVDWRAEEAAARRRDAAADAARRAPTPAELEPPDEQALQPRPAPRRRRLGRKGAS